ncbi:hypothetical protein F4810DRAFT_726321 [Camillea tinctor]|nr:hypothetical protein F4810DRAFT_726321 [Camillea tinctor]
MASSSVQAIAPRAWAPVLFGFGRFIRDEYDNLKFQDDGELQYIVPVSEAFLNIEPTPFSRECWPEMTSAMATASPSRDTHVVFLALNVSTACYDTRIITEVGYTTYDTADRYFGANIQRWHQKFAQGCQAPLDRGKEIMKFAGTQHFIVSDTADHHPATCSQPYHSAQPYDFAFKKSITISREHLRNTLENVFHVAEHKNLEEDAINRGEKRKVVLLNWGPALHPTIKMTSWYKERQFLEFWDINQHPVIRNRFPSSVTAPPALVECLDTFGIGHRIRGLEIGRNSGNATVYLVRLLIVLCHLTQEQKDTINNGGSLDELDVPAGQENVLARINRLPGTNAPPPNEHVQYTRPPRPQSDSYRMVRYSELTR